MAAPKRLSDADVLWVRKMHARGHSYATLGKSVGCSATHARDIVHGKRRPIVPPSTRKA
jgi:hypothetical protein